jgi:membrane-bound lytic murein transglycosylase A
MITAIINADKELFSRPFHSLFIALIRRYQCQRLQVCFLHLNQIAFSTKIRTNQNLQNLFIHRIDFKKMRNQFSMKRLFLPLLLCLSLLSCAKPAPVTKPEDALERISWWRAVAPNDDREFRDIAVAVQQSLDYYRKLPPETPFSFGRERVTAGDMVDTLQNFLGIVENEAFSYEEKVKQVKESFVLYRATGSDGHGRVLFTGYYEPVLSCRTNADSTFKYPLYKRPDDIIEVDLTQFGNGFPKNKILGRLDGKKIIPYFSREEIDAKNVLGDRKLEILWCNDPVDIYFLQVQGSGKADLGDGKMLSVLYDGQNGRSYTSIGRYLIDSGMIPKEEMSMQITRLYLRDNPERMSAILNQNPSYVFFRTGSESSVGNIGVPLTPQRSIATDSRLFPKGALALIATTKPAIENGVIKEWAPFTRFVMNQDTGGAIRGAGRVDLFWGQGPEAELSAGYMQQEGELYFLMKKK